MSKFFDDFDGQDAINVDRYGFYAAVELQKQRRKQEYLIRELAKALAQLDIAEVPYEIKSMEVA